MNAMTAKLNTMKTDDLVEVIIGLRDTYTDEANTVQSAALAILETRIDEAQFVRFCDDLYNTMA